MSIMAKHICTKEDGKVGQMFSFSHITKNVHAHKFKFFLSILVMFRKSSKQQPRHLVHRLLV